jgi:hypothetical protein
MPAVFRPFAGVARESGNAPAARLMRHLRRSRALASLLPALLMSGAVTLALTALMLERRVAGPFAMGGFSGSWMETWLTSWSFAFPLVYPVFPAARRLGAFFLRTKR